MGRYSSSWGRSCNSYSCNSHPSGSLPLRIEEAEADRDSEDEDEAGTDKEAHMGENKGEAEDEDKADVSKENSCVVEVIDNEAVGRVMHHGEVAQSGYGYLASTDVNETKGAIYDSHLQGTENATEDIFRGIQLLSRYRRFFPKEKKCVEGLQNPILPSNRTLCPPNSLSLLFGGTS